MKKLLVQSDDFGCTNGCVDGAIYGIKNGIVKNTGIFMNMPCVEYAAERLKEVDVCLGIDINLLAGPSVSDPKLIPGLIKENNMFRSSRDLLRDNKVTSVEKYIYHFEKDPFDYDECVIETTAQIEKFIKMFNKLPAYINSHSIMTLNSEKAAYDVAAKYGINRMSSDLYFGEDKFNDIAYFGYYEPKSLEEQIDIDYTEHLLNKILPNLSEDKINFYMCHCGYPDKALFKLTTLTLQRMNDVYCVTDERVKKYIKENDIELITYYDIDFNNK